MTISKKCVHGINSPDIELLKLSQPYAAQKPEVEFKTDTTLNQ